MNRLPWTDLTIVDDIPVTVNRSGRPIQVLGVRGRAGLVVRPLDQPSPFTVPSGGMLRLAIVGWTPARHMTPWAEVRFRYENDQWIGVGVLRIPDVLLRNARKEVR